MFAAFLALSGLAISFIFVPVMGELGKAVACIEARNPGKFGSGNGYGQVYGSFNIVFSLGSLLGPFHGGAVFKDSMWNRTVLSLGIIAAVTTVPTMLFTGGNLVNKFKTFRST